jgi:hypothetical protein
MFTRTATSQCRKWELSPLFPIAHVPPKSRGRWHLVWERDVCASVLVPVSVVRVCLSVCEVCMCVCLWLFTIICFNTFSRPNSATSHPISLSFQVIGYKICLYVSTTSWMHVDTNVCSMMHYACGYTCTKKKVKDPLLMFPESVTRLLFSLPSLPLPYVC